MIVCHFSDTHTHTHTWCCRSFPSSFENVGRGIAANVFERKQTRQQTFAAWKSTNVIFQIDFLVYVLIVRWCCFVVAPFIIIVLGSTAIIFHVVSSSAPSQRVRKTKWWGFPTDWGENSFTTSSCRKLGAQKDKEALCETCTAFITTKLVSWEKKIVLESNS